MQEGEYQDGGELKQLLVGFGQLAVIVGFLVLVIVQPSFMTDRSLWINRGGHLVIVLGTAVGFVSGAMVERIYQTRRGKLDGHYFWWEYLAMPIW